MKFDHRFLFKVFLLAAPFALLIWMIVLKNSMNTGLIDPALELLFGLPLALIILMVIVMVSAFIEQSRGQPVPMSRFGLYLVITVVLGFATSFFFWIINLGFTS